jgi:glycosyltransferase involved in cell wall biosynthesis
MSKSRHPVISVITPVFNGSTYIEETIESVLRYGSRFEIEYIVVNDGSTDCTSEILQKFENRIKVISQPNLGESQAVNTGIESAQGDYVLIVSCDDPLFTSDIFENVETFFSSNQKVVAWYPDWRMIDSKGEPTTEICLPEYSEELMIGRFKCLPGPGTFFRRDKALEIGGRNPNRIFTGDYDFWLRLSMKGEIRHRSQVLAQWRQHPESTSVSKRGPEMALERIEVIRDLVSDLDIEPRIRRMSIAHAYYHAAILSYFSENVPGKRYLFRAFSARKGWIEDARIIVILYILLLPFSRIERLFRRTKSS